MDQTDIDKLRVSLAHIYGFDLDATTRDAAAIDEKIADESPANALDFYLNRPPLGSAPGTAPPLPGLAGEIVTPEILNIETFEFSEIGEDHSLRDRLVEQNLDSAVGFLQHCMSLRREYGEIAKLHLDTEIKTREFFRLDNIHEREVDAGVYKNPNDEAEEDRKAAVSALAAASAALTAAQNQKQVADSLYQNDTSQDRLDYTGSFANKRQWTNQYQRELMSYGDPGADHYVDVMNRAEWIDLYKRV